MSVYSFQRELPVFPVEYDVLVAGGGPAGCAAAVSAARLGARVLLLEETGALGGMGTSGLVSAFDPMADGTRNLVAGFMKELVDELYRRGDLGPGVVPEFWEKAYMRWTPFSVEGLKRLLDEKVLASGAEVRLFTSLIEADSDRDGKRLRGVVINNIDGMSYVRAKTFIDATGDGVLCHLAGAECLTNPGFMPGTLCSLHSGIDWERARHENQQEALTRALADGHFTRNDRHLPGMSRVGQTLGYLNGGHLFGRDALKNADRTKAMAEGRKLLQEYVSFYRKYVPGCENMELVISAALFGVRETRRIAGEYQLTYQDFLQRRQFPDQIGVFNKFVDIHVRDDSEEEFQRHVAEKDQIGRLAEGECFGIPYGILVPKGWNNLWSAGRCNSSDEMMHGTIRVQPAASMMGQAAGTAAVQALAEGTPAARIDTARLVESLRGQNVYLPQTETSRELTRE